MNVEVNNRILKCWTVSLGGITGATFQCPWPLSADETEDVLAMMELIGRQIVRQIPSEPNVTEVQP